MPDLDGIDWNIKEKDMKRYCKPWMLVLAALLVSCSGEEPDEVDAAADTGTVEEEAIGPSEAELVIADSETALVQVVVEGLSVFYESKEPQLEAVFFPSSGHNLELAEGYFHEDGDLRWNSIGSIPSRTEISLPHKIGPFREFSFGRPPSGGTASSRYHAASTYWAVKARYLADTRGDHTLLEDQEGSRLALDTYQLETCALVFDSQYGGACEVRPITLRDTRKNPIAASEIMVLRAEVKLSEMPDDLKCDSSEEGCWKLIQVGDEPKEIQMVDLQPCDVPNNKCVEWARKEGRVWKRTLYQKVFDISLRNISKGPRPATREIKTKHAGILADLFKGNRTDQWNMEAVGCIDEENECICRGEQPKCWEHVRRYYYDDEQGKAKLNMLIAENSTQGVTMEVMSPSNLAICPIVDHP